MPNEQYCTISPIELVRKEQRHRYPTPGKHDVLFVDGADHF